ncbi:MAG: carbohydrate binding family 9 domain-containing protein [Gemmatimonadaceae bacterium]|nr:carbohydrate binding family 9 domain-containing protein [Gemmatimonadaceae bacterium]
MLTVALALAVTLADPPVHNGRSGQTKVTPPRLAAEVVVDGNLTEPVWQQAAVLTGFSQFSPQDGIPAADSTRILVWYSATAIHFGVRAYEPHGTVRATLAERDRISADDHIQFLIGTFNDGRQAVMFAVNPFGVQADGALVEQGNRSGGFMSGGATAARESADLSQDYVFQSKGHLTDFGYEVELTIPFKSLRFQSTAEQTWGFNVVRRVQHSNYEDSWTPALRANASFLAQSGTLAGLTDLHRGLVLDVTPELTDRVDGTPGAAAWGYRTADPQLGATVRWGITNNLTFNGTFNPDFSQVEADANQLNFDPRRAVQIPERRPFFIDGIEQFQTPNGLVYTRRIVQPQAAGKVSGKMGATNVALMTAVDDRVASSSGQDSPIFNILRLSRDLGRQSRLAMTYTDRIDGDNSNRVLSVDGRGVLGRIYSGSFQVAGARTVRNGTTTTAPLFDVRANRDGRAFGVRSQFSGIDRDFLTQSGFIGRTGEVHASVAPRYTWFFERGSRVETFSYSMLFDGTWNYDRFMQRGDARDKKMHFNASTLLRGGWTLGGSLLVETFGYDPTFYADLYRIEAPDGLGGLDTLPFVGTPRLPNRDWVLSFTSPRFKYFQASGSWVWGQDENFFEWASADILYAQLTLNARPSERIRVDATYQIQEYKRKSDGSLVGTTRNPRVKLEYQVSRPFFVRVIGEYVAVATDALRDDTRTGFPLLQRTGSGVYVRTTPSQTNSLRGDLLLAYTPQPGTVVYLGYGARMFEPEPFRYQHLARQSDAVFLKLSYLFRR